eukprot:TRINITY_DN22280_c0_g1_i2.p1 TRINITY_DN22280_c0_g1~~TRINITY_DN22280_c0_g1_i2.p1  ORF type:complete len:205 (+),score=40.83 TRINITY_DN22280_c0_g1_i2:71-685(+)
MQGEPAPLVVELDIPPGERVGFSFACLRGESFEGIHPVARGGVFVTQVTDGAPAERAGLRRGLRVASIDDVDLGDAGQEAVVAAVQQWRTRHTRRLVVALDAGDQRCYAPGTKVVVWAPGYGQQGGAAWAAGEVAAVAAGGAGYDVQTDAGVMLQDLHGARVRLAEDGALPPLGTQAPPPPQAAPASPRAEAELDRRPRTWSAC